MQPKKHPDSAVLFKYNDDDYSHAYGQIKEAFKALTKDDILQPYMSEHDFRSSNDGDFIGYKLYVSVRRYQKNFESAQPIKVKFRFSSNVHAVNYGNALVLTKKLVGWPTNVRSSLNLRLF